MAVVKDYYMGNTHVVICDDAYANLTEEEIQQRKQLIQDRVNAIVRRARERKESPA